MFHHRPKLPYCGLAIVLDNPSRFDLNTKRLISGQVGDYFSDNLGVPIGACHIYDRVDVTTDEFPEGTKVALVLGEFTARQWSGKGSSIHKLRGIPFYYKGVACIPSYLPQETFDMEPFELHKNPLARAILEESKREDDPDEKNSSRTGRSTWKWWLKEDARKAVLLLKHHNGVIPTTSPNIQIYPHLNDVEKHYATLPPTASIYFDIENDSARNLLCFGLGDSDSDTVFSIPILRHTYSMAYHDWPRIFRLLGHLFNTHEVVIHNSMYDLGVLATKYGIAPPTRIFDTMLAQHRIFPEIAKSLGHCLSYWTFEQFHKDDGVFMPVNNEQEQRLWKYNARDVWTMRLIHQGQVRYASTIPGLLDSIKVANSMVRPYLLISLMGLHYNEQVRASRLEELDAQLNGIMRILKLLLGFELLPSSPKQLNHYFSELMGYKAYAKTEKGDNSWGGANLIKLRLAHPENVAIYAIMKFKILQKMAGELKFKPYKT